MPAAPHLVPLDTAKTWAKRLHRIQADQGLSSSLSGCQEALARMLGHTDWHALQQASQASTAPSQDLWGQDLARIRQQHPHLPIQDLESLALDLDVLEGDAYTIQSRQRELEYEGEKFPDEAFEQALRENTVTVVPPDGHRFACVRLHDGRRALVILPVAPAARHRPR